MSTCLQSKNRWGKDTNIVCYLSVEDFLKLGFSDRHAVMSLRIECLTNTFVITKVLVKIDDVFSVKQMSNILFVSERTVLRRMVEYGLKIRNFSNIYDDQLDSDVLALANYYSFYGETDLREFLKGRWIIIQPYRSRDGIHRISEVYIQSRRKGRLKRRI